MVYWEFDYKYDYTVNGVTKTGTSWSACGGSLIDVYTVLTAAHCIERFVTIEETGEKYRVRPNKYHPTIGSAYAVYVGLHDKSRIGGNISPAVKMEVEDVIVVSWFFYSQPLREIGFGKFDFKTYIKTIIILFQKKIIVKLNPFFYEIFGKI